MTKEEFFKAKDKWQQFKFSSLAYTDYEEIADYEIVVNDDSAIIIYGYNIEDKKYEYHWACNNQEDLIKRLQKRNDNEIIKFVPKKWVEAHRSIGFDVYAVWKEYFASDLEVYANFEEPTYVDDNTHIEASEVTLSCTGQSRGFSGQSQDWIKQWIHNNQPAAPDYVSHCAVIADVKHEMRGVICVGIYGSEEKRILWVREIAVKPEYQGKGIARKLMGQAFAYGIKHGAKKSFLMADECNENALHLYKNMGFVESPDEGQIDMVR